MPSVSETQSAPEPQYEEILTLPEAAAYLRVGEEALAKLANDRAVPAQRIGQEWRFLKRALADWLRQGTHYYREFHGLPPWAYEYPLVEELAHRVVKRLLIELAPIQRQPSPKPGSKQAVLKHFGIFRDDPSIQQMLDDIYARRKGRGEEVEE